MKRTFRLPIFFVTLLFGGLMIAASGNTVSKDAPKHQPSFQSHEAQDSPFNLSQENLQATPDQDLVTGDKQKTASNNPTVTAPVLDRSQLTFKQKVALKVVERKIAKEVKRTESPRATNGKSQLIALLLVIFLGYLGIHRFYLGHIGIGILMLLTGGICGILVLIDLIRIITGDLRPKGGDYDETF